MKQFRITYTRGALNGVAFVWAEDRAAALFAFKLEHPDANVSGIVEES